MSIARVTLPVPASGEEFDRVVYEDS